MLLTETSKLTPAELDQMREGGKIWRNIKDSLVSEVKVGVTGSYINDKAKELFDQHKVETAFFNYQNFPGHICVSVNDCIIHGVGNDTPIKSGDKITLDIGFKYKDVYIDSAHTVVVDPDTNPEYAKFVERCEKALWAGIKAAKEVLKSGSQLFNGDIAYAIESFIRSFNDKNCSIIDGFVGHAIGKKIHMKPNIFNKGFKKGQGDKLSEGMVICIEPMLLQQPTGEVKKGRNGFDIFAKVDGAFTCHWEHMVMIKGMDLEVLTASEEEIKKYLG